MWWGLPFPQHTLGNVGLWGKEKVMLQFNFVLGRQGKLKFVVFVILHAFDNFLNYFAKDCSNVWFSIIRHRGNLNVYAFGHSLSSNPLSTSSFLVSGSWIALIYIHIWINSFFYLSHRLETRQHTCQTRDCQTRDKMTCSRRRQGKLSKTCYLEGFSLSFSLVRICFGSILDTIVATWDNKFT